MIVKTLYDMTTITTVKSFMSLCNMQNEPIGKMSLDGKSLEQKMWRRRTTWQQLQMGRNHQSMFWDKETFQNKTQLEAEYVPGLRNSKYNKL
jgi:hypothetical protein